MEPIKFIQSHNMNFEKGNVIKYVTRAGKKEGQNEVKDLKKARQYLDFLIWKLEDEQKNDKLSYCTICRKKLR
ncbi:TPA: DUF3310 domain-containing protein [Listeria monocytogenes]|nr:DUF3310 domain-containing protein [Listeria monocytogenes]EIO1327560.1 DUF3310 domain-containing protein [Listeria innocua]EAC9483497.1 DUF3310 domain-containing protein [Listeria monocytogenes]EAD1967027.1 DUF3310 domain-containing protein [Listeria monocytogenes]EAD2398348.1 exonuclease [Listeria monocytogenes]